MASESDYARSEYTTGNQLGSGTFGVVYEAERKCALKSIKMGNLTKEERAAKRVEWNKEVDILQQVKGSEYIVEYRNSFTSGESGGHLWVEMEFCNGGTFNDYILQKKPGTTVKLRLMTEISSAVAFLHTRQPCVVHRDLKPENIMINYDDAEEPHAKVADFGLAKAIASCTLGGNMKKYYLRTACGTPYFMAPEVYEDHYDEKADVFSMGVIFHAMVPDNVSLRSKGGKELLLTYISVEGVPCPFGKHIHETKKKIGYSDDAASKISANAKQLILEMILPRSNERPSAEDVCTRLKNMSPKDLNLQKKAPIPYSEEH